MPQQLANFPTPEEYKEMYSKWKEQNLPNSSPDKFRKNDLTSNSGTVLSIVLMTSAIIVMIMFVVVYFLRQEATNQEILNRLNQTITNMVGSSSTSKSVSSSSANSSAVK